MKNKELDEYLLNSCKFILTKGVNEYRATIDKYINRNDVVLEIGFAWGTTTELLSKASRHVVGIDKGESFYSAVEDYPELELHKIDAFDIKSVKELGYDFNKIYIDISGCRELMTVIKILRMYENTFKPEFIVMKSSRLKSLVSQCSVWEG